MKWRRPRGVNGHDPSQESREFKFSQGEDHEVGEGEEETKKGEEMKARREREEVDVVEEVQEESDRWEELNGQGWAQVDHRIVLKTVGGGREGVSRILSQHSYIIIMA
jgi:hypothetical protein